MEILSEQFVFLNTKFKTQGEVFQFVSDKLCKAGRAEQSQTLVNGFLKREEEFSTYVENGVSIPHCRVDTVTETTVAIVKNAQPVLWNDEGDKSNLIILLAVPLTNASDLHLKVLSRIAQSLLDEEIVRQLMTLESPTEICNVLTSVNKID